MTSPLANQISGICAVRIETLHFCICRILFLRRLSWLTTTKLSAQIIILSFLLLLTITVIITVIMAANIVTMEDVKSWLSTVGFEQYGQTFEGMLFYQQ